MIETIPTVDAVEVVRCKDCKWWSEDDNDSYGYCMAMKHGYMSPNWEIRYIGSIKVISIVLMAKGEKMNKDNSKLLTFQQGDEIISITHVVDRKKPVLIFGHDGGKGMINDAIKLATFDNEEDAEIFSNVLDRWFNAVDARE